MYSILFFIPDLGNALSCDGSSAFVSIAKVVRYHGMVVVSR